MEEVLKTGIDEKIDKKLEEIAKDTSRQILYEIKNKKSRPSVIYLYGAKQDYLTSLLVKLGLKFKEYEEKTGEDINIDIFTYLGKGYSVNVGAYFK